ncbi:NAD-binding protein [Neobacillus sp. M.A.Huq-85]|nr:NAD-binding protein [Neobacillus cucumis]
MIRKLDTVGEKMNYTGKNHIILIGWNDKSKILIREILKFNETIDFLVINNLEKNHLTEENLFYIYGDPTDEKTLSQANLPEAKGVIIFANQLTQINSDSKGTLLIDGKTLLIATALTFVQEKLNTSIYVIAEIMNQDHIRLFNNIKVNKFILTEEINSYEVINSLLDQ